MAIKLFRVFQFSAVSERKRACIFESISKAVAAIHQAKGFLLRKFHLHISVCVLDRYFGLEWVLLITGLLMLNIVLLTAKFR